MSENKLGGLQIIRGVAACAVVLDHVTQMAAGQKYFGRTIFSGMFETGRTGVDLFFCLSGFIICFVALRPVSLEPRLSVFQFLARRFVRIIPFLWVILAINLIAQAATHTAFDPLEYVRAFTLFPVGMVHPAQVWTLRHEFLFYTLFALSFLFRRRFILLLWAVLPALVAPFVPSDSWLGFLFNRVNILFGCGVLVGLLYLRRPAGLMAPTVAVVIACATVFLAASLIGYDRTSTWQVAVIGVLSSLAVFTGSRVDARAGVWKVGLILGDASYSIYLAHTLAISITLKALSRLAPHAPDAVILGLGSTLAIGFGVLVHYGLERPVVRLSSRLIRKSPPAFMQAAA